MYHCRPYQKNFILIWDSLGPSPALALSHIAAQCTELRSDSRLISNVIGLWCEMEPLGAQVRYGTPRCPSAIWNPWVPHLRT